MFAMLKTVSAGIALAVVVGVTTPVSAASTCVRIDDVYFKHGVVVKATECVDHSTPRMKEVTPRAPTFTDKCEGKAKGYEYLALGPDGKRLARFVCRGS